MPNQAASKVSFPKCLMLLQDIKSTVGKSSKGEKYVAVMEEEEYMEKEYMPKDIPSKGEFTWLATCH